MEVSRSETYAQKSDTTPISVEWQRVREHREFIARYNVVNGTRLTMTYIWKFIGVGKPVLVTCTGTCKLVRGRDKQIIAIHVQSWVTHHALLSQITSLTLA